MKRKKIKFVFSRVTRQFFFEISKGILKIVKIIILRILLPSEIQKVFQNEEFMNFFVMCLVLTLFLHGTLDFIVESCLHLQFSLFDKHISWIFQVLEWSIGVQSFARKIEEIE